MSIERKVKVVCDDCGSNVTLGDGTEAEIKDDLYFNYNWLTVNMGDTHFCSQCRKQYDT